MSISSMAATAALNRVVYLMGLWSIVKAYMQTVAKRNTDLMKIPITRVIVNALNSRKSCLLTAIMPSIDSIMLITPNITITLGAPVLGNLSSTTAVKLVEMVFSTSSSFSDSSSKLYSNSLVLQLITSMQPSINMKTPIMKINELAKSRALLIIVCFAT